jgi:hypothetical protein
LFRWLKLFIHSIQIKTATRPNNLIISSSRHFRRVQLKSSQSLGDLKRNCNYCCNCLYFTFNSVLDGFEFAFIITSIIRFSIERKGTEQKGKGNQINESNI